MDRILLVVGVVAFLAVACIVLASDPDTDSREIWRVRYDTNATTVTTGYSAPAAGALLCGKNGGTNTVWISVAAGTNHWVRVANE